MSDKESNTPKRGKVQEHKLIPEDVDEKLTRVEKIIAHFEQGFFLDDRGLKYYKKLEQVFHAVFNYKTKAQCVRVVVMQQRCSRKEAYDLLEDVELVFGNFFEVNKKAKRYLMEHRLDYLYQKAIADNDIERAESIVEKICKLYDLYNPKDDDIKTRDLKLPKVRRSSNPQLLENKSNGPAD